MLLLMDNKTKNKILHVCEYVKNNNLTEKLNQYISPSAIS